MYEIANEYHIRINYIVFLLFEGFYRADFPHMGPYGCLCATIRLHGSSETFMRTEDGRASEPWSPTESQSPNVGRGRPLRPLRNSTWATTRLNGIPRECKRN